ncbi:hypothetical protein LDDCCGHA_0590 [Methylobacterium oxalidis]|jgi:hypothetical protein|nr:hypothetical protein LDDCCGHA_0590 [Methylobacterium oxalidis]
MLWIALAALGGATLMGIAAVYTKQTLIDDARSGTRGYF